VLSVRLARSGTAYEAVTTANDVDDGRPA
jgi:hypothetical protein